MLVDQAVLFRDSFSCNLNRLRNVFSVMPFLLAFACALPAVPTSGVFQCSKSTIVRLAGVSTVKDVDGGAGSALGAGPLKIRCQGFDQRGKQEIVATCRTAGGEDLACLLARQGFVREIRREQRRYELSACVDRPQIRREI